MIAEQIADELAPYLGAFNAKVAVKTFAMKTLNLRTDELTIDHVPALLESLRRLLHTFIGKEATDVFLAELQQRIG